MHFLHIVHNFLNISCMCNNWNCTSLVWDTRTQVSTCLSRWEAILPQQTPRHKLNIFTHSLISDPRSDPTMTMTIASVMPVQFCTFVIFNTYLFRVMWGAWKGIRGYGASAESKFLPHFGSQPASQDSRKKQVGLGRKPTNRTAEATLRNNLWLLKRTSWNMIHLSDTIG